MVTARDSFTFTFAYGDSREVIAIGAALPAVCIVVVFLRFITRFLSKNRIGVDDWLILGGLISVIGLGACLIIGAAGGGLGYPTPERSAGLTDFHELSYISPASVLALKIILMLALGFIKLSILFFYRRIFVSHRGNRFDILNKTAIVVIFLWTFAYLFIDVFACGSHLTASWGSLEQQSLHCDITGYTSEYGFVISDLILDVFVICLPLLTAWRLQMSKTRKIAVTGTILLGAAAVGALVARLVLYVEVLRGIAAGVQRNKNLDITTPLWWSMLEVGLALIAACLPTLTYLFRGLSLQLVVHSIRSVFSLRLLRPSQSIGQSGWTEPDNLYVEIKVNGSKLSHDPAGDEEIPTKRNDFEMRRLTTKEAYKSV
ncbi:MAG: hypothetical protein MMC23_001484 [Stictis urceolatum]|nr:hypothetical protein [Stictis urceolata]